MQCIFNFAPVMYFRRVVLFLSFVLLFATTNVLHAKVSLYGVVLPDSAIMKATQNKFTDSVWRAHPILNSKHIYSEVQQEHSENGKTRDFYLLLSLCIVLGVIKFVDQKYFYDLWTAFWNPTLSNRQLKDRIQDAGLPELMMNVFFAIVTGAYVFYIVRFFTPNSPGGLSPSFLVVLLILGIGVIYLAKYSAVRFSGWAFRMEAITTHYLFNVFLVNKILAILLLPFVITMAFADKHVADQVMYISFVVAGLLIFNRYMRSWQLFGPFFQNSKFHFFMYLCASELLPLAVLIKFLVKGL